jgi:hypothetical protein
MFLMLSGKIPPDAVKLSEPLDLSATVAAPPQQLASKQCWNSRFGSGVETEEKSVD